MGIYCSFIVIIARRTRLTIERRERYLERRERERGEAHAVLVLFCLRETRERHVRLKYLSPSEGLDDVCA